MQTISSGRGSVNLYQDVFFRGVDTLRGRKTISTLRFLRKSQYWPQERLLAWQEL